MGSTVTELMRRRMMGARGGEHDYSKDYLTIEMLESGDISFVIPKSLNTDNLTNVSYSTDDGRTWVTTPNADETIITITTPTLSIGSKVLWKGEGVRLATSVNNHSRFLANYKTFNVSGNILSLLCGDNYEQETRPNSRAFNGLFRDSCVVDASNLILSGVMGADMYNAMFNGCAWLIAPPQLPSTLSGGCFSNMFINCTSLEVAPTLSASTLQQWAYSYMFQGCSSLRYIKMLATDISAYRCLYDWVNDVGSTGTFVKSVDATWSESGVVPSGWTVITE